jgi:hypothetical protein
MNETKLRRSIGSKFSIRHLLMFTALIAVGFAVGIEHRKNRLLTQQLGELRSLSGQLQIDNVNELASAALPDLAEDIHSWKVYVPESQDYELRLGMGAISEKGIPPVVDSVQLKSGQHRVTLYKGDSTNEEFRYVVYVDGLLVMESTMGRDWMPGGWSWASGISWPRGPELSPPPLQLAARSYEPNRDFGILNDFNGQSDDYVTRLGYRLWIDKRDRIYQPPSPFIGFPEDPQLCGVGLRDGIRYCRSFRTPYQWTFTRPKLATNDPVLRIEAEFFASDGTVLSSQSQSFQSWQLRDAASGESTLHWQEEPPQTTHTVFLHATLESQGSLQPVVEFKWDADKLDAVGLRLADTPANDLISRWRLRILDGSHHLWRELRVDESPWISPDDALEASKIHGENSAQPSNGTALLDLGDEATADIHVQWQTNETLPLQIVEESQNAYTGLALYKGLPITLGIQIPASLTPSLTVEVVDEHPLVPGTSLPGGPVFDGIQIDVNADHHDWIWLSTKLKE